MFDDLVHVRKPNHGYFGLFGIVVESVVHL